MLTWNVEQKFIFVLLRAEGRAWVRESPVNLHHVDQP
jgi:hypothetical protein